MIKHFLSLASFSPQDLQALIERAHFFSLHLHQPEKIPLLLKQRIYVNAFYEPSTRTRCSFEMAIKRLGGEVINFVPENSSAKKGEGLEDTLKTFQALVSDGIIFRHSDDHILDEIQSQFKVPLINAGAGKYEHPSQGLLDLLTLYQEFGKLEGLEVAICGDIKHSRVAGSMIVAAKIFGMKIYFCGPENLLPSSTDQQFINADFESILPKVDAVMMLRLQLERHQGLELDAQDYQKQFGMNLNRQKTMKKNAIIMHPGPFNRGVEITDEMVEHPQSRIFKQVTNGVASRMAILEWIERGRNK